MITASHLFIGVYYELIEVVFIELGDRSLKSIPTFEYTYRQLRSFVIKVVVTNEFKKEIMAVV